METKCPICLLTFNRPLSLACGHIYCTGCLQAMEEGSDQHRCPECQIEYGGTKNLVKNPKTPTQCAVSTTGQSADHHVVENVPFPEVDSSNSARVEECNQEKYGELNTNDRPKDGRKLPFHQNEEVGGSSAKKEMEKPKFKLASQVTELHVRLEMADHDLEREKEIEFEMSEANSQLRQKAAKLLEQVKDVAHCYTEEVTLMIEEALRPQETSIRKRVSEVSELTKKLRQTVLRAESLLTEDDHTAFHDELQSIQPRMAELLAKPEEIDESVCIESHFNRGAVCSKLENMNNDLKKSLVEIQRSLHNTLNPSEITFDPETAHPNLILSEDLKTVTFSPTKQLYPASLQRFTSFFQVLSTQSFFEGEHSWQVDVGGSPWIIGMCYSEKLERSGLPSALESSRNSWCLMWFNNLLTAFEQSHSVPLKKTTMSRRLEIKLSFKTHRLGFYDINPTAGKTHIYTFKANFNEPLKLAYRMMSGNIQARATVSSEP